ncbi:hypothetical protein ABZP36_010874 [Zizania latifolia]
MRKQKRNYPSRIRSSGGQTTIQSFLFKSTVVDGELKPSPPPEKEEETISPPQPPKREIIRVTKATIKVATDQTNPLFPFPSQSLKREMLRGGIWQEKASAFSSVGSPSSGSGKRGGGEASGPTALNAAMFKRFKCSGPAPRAGAASSSGGVAELAGVGDSGGLGVRLVVEEISAGGRRETGKRKSPLGDGEHNGSTKRVVVLGDDPKPRPATRMVKRRHARPAGRGEGGDQALYNHYASGGGWWHGEMEGVDGEEVGWTDDMWEGMGSIALGGLDWH